MTGSVVAEERVYLKVQTTLGYVQYLSRPHNQYERYGPDDPWTKTSGGASSFALPKLDSTAHANVLSNLEDITVAGKERLRDIDVTNITARANMERKAEQAWDDVDQMSDGVRQGVDTPRKQMLAGEKSSSLGSARTTVSSTGTQPTGATRLAVTSKPMYIGKPSPSRISTSPSTFRLRLIRGPAALTMETTAPTRRPCLLRSPPRGRIPR